MLNNTSLTTYFENEYKIETQHMNTLGIPVTDSFVRSRLNIPAEKTPLQRLISWLRR